MKPTITYICKDSGIKFNKLTSDRNSFIGYEIKKYGGSISAILELDGNGVSSKIQFRSTKIPIISTITCRNGYTQERYTNGNISREYRVGNSNEKYGEHLKYTPNGVLSTRYFFNKVDITEDILQLIGFKGNSNDFLKYQFGTDEMFNLGVRYGLEFQFYNEFKHDHARFNQIAQYCLTH